ncbi:hypothetical protein WG66_014776 [Moniliophthora roreri]|nr:hypothetical protein WG66_014776 [Moniliophthora roreri]
MPLRQRGTKGPSIDGILLKFVAKYHCRRTQGYGLFFRAPKTSQRYGHEEYQQPPNIQLSPCPSPLTIRSYNNLVASRVSSASPAISYHLRNLRRLPQQRQYRVPGFHTANTHNPSAEKERTAIGHQVSATQPLDDLPRRRYSTAQADMRVSRHLNLRLR